MTEEQKNILIGKLIDNPVSLSDEELDRIIADDELREIYEISATLKGISAGDKEIDIDKEWKLFRHRLHPRKSIFRPIMKIAAIFISVILIGGIGAEFIDRLLTSDNPQLISKTEIPGKTNDTQIKLPVVEKDTVIVEKPRIAASRKVRSTHTASLSTIPPIEPEELIRKEDKYSEEDMRIQEARMDNEMAMAYAEIYLDEYRTMQEMMELPDYLDKRMSNTIINLTMQ